MVYSTYILYSKLLDKYYVGSTNNLENRLFRHNSGYNKFTKTGIPWELVFVENFDLSFVFYCFAPPNHLKKIVAYCFTMSLF